jgi:hypothetical protein
MRPIFTIHAGEFIFGETLLKRFREIELWIPAKDRGIDFLVTKPNREKPISVQVKMSRDYRPNAAKTALEKAQLAGGWFTFNHEKLAKSNAEIWSLILVSIDRRSNPFFINIPPQELLKRLVEVFGEQKTYRSYPWILRLDKASPALCVEGRNLRKNEKQHLARHGSVEPPARNLTSFYDNWSAFE